MANETTPDADTKTTAVSCPSSCHVVTGSGRELSTDGVENRHQGIRRGSETERSGSRYAGDCATVREATVGATESTPEEVDCGKIEKVGQNRDDEWAKPTNIEERGRRRKRGRGRGKAERAERKKEEDQIS